MIGRVDRAGMAREAALSARDWSAVDRYAAALATFTESEPLPWSSYFIARGRTLANFGRGRCDNSTLGELRHLRNQAGQAGLKLSVEAIEQAQSTGSFGQMPHDEVQILPMRKDGSNLKLN